MEVFLQWGIMLLGILGVVQLGELLSIWLRRPKKRPTSFCVMPLHGSIGNVEQVLTYFQEVALWSPEVQLAFVIDCGLEERSALACKEWCNQKNPTHWSHLPHRHAHPGKKHAHNGPPGIF